MATLFKVTLRTDQQNKEGQHQVRIRIQKHNQTRYYGTGIFVKYEKGKRSEWNPEHEDKKANWITSKHTQAGALNAKIKAILARFHHLDTDYPTYTVEQLRDKYDEPEEVEEKKGFIAFAEELIRRKEARGQYVTASNNRSALNIFKSFWNNRPDNPDLLTPAQVSALMRGLRSGSLREHGEGGYAESSINIYFAFYAATFRQSMLEGWVPPRPNPFDQPPLLVKEKPKERPSIEVIFQLKEMEGLNEPQTHARNLFIMQFLLHGARVSEAYSLTWADVGDIYIMYWPKKRAKKAKYIKRNAEIDAILKQYPTNRKYVFPYLTEADDKLEGYALVRRMRGINTTVDRHLKAIAVKAKLPPLTTHMPRKAMADYVWAKNNNVRDVAAILGHASSVHSEGYIASVDQLALDELMADVFSEVQGKLRESAAGNGRIEPSGKQQISALK